MTDGMQLTSTSAAATQPPCRALVVVTPPHAVRSDERPLASFVAQLIACRSRLPGFRKAGRERPAVARNSYTQAAGRPSAGRLVVVA